ncbi:helix-turn-helix transcriptional regulator [Rathayibacter agropyri]|uniref:helix-turn-helix transcriptional regulator n=1 Tax=Rathayibacter agropyri TaxID=1634927 RepID=UPI0015643667|nr:helix-turn-helix transcriptional regulator [Rathayibacter agropyri]NRD08993.1 helix-turn-helix transcriptional regulator [Rathayibacter agropyri]
MLLRAGGEDHLLEKGDAVLYRAASLISTASELPVAVLEIELGTGSGERLNSGLINDSYFVPRTVRAVRLLSVLINEILASSDETDQRISRRCLIAVEAIAADLVEETDYDLPSGLSPSDRRLVSEARRIIRSQLDDHALSIATLASEMSVTERRVQMAFAALGTTPTREIRMRRADAAEALLLTYSRVSSIELERVAHQVGLRSARAVRDLLVAFDRTIPAG